MHNLVRRTAAALAIALVASPASAASWICEVNYASGYELVGDHYRPTILEVNRRYLLRPFRADIDVGHKEYYQDDDPPRYVAVEFGSEIPVAYFWADLATAGTTSSILGTREMTFHKEPSLLVVSTVNHIITSNHLDGTKYTPSTSIAKCARLD